MPHPVPLHEGTKGPECVEVFTCSTRGWSKSLTLWALLHIFLCIMEHLGPIVSLVDGFIGEGSADCMIPTVTVVDLLHYLLYFVWSESP